MNVFSPNIIKRKLKYDVSRFESFDQQFKKKMKKKTVWEEIRQLSNILKRLQYYLKKNVFFVFNVPRKIIDVAIVDSSSVSN